MEQILLVTAYSYFLGSIPFGLVLTKLFTKTDIRKKGSGNIGATNVIRSGSKILGVITLILDSFKGYLSVIITINIFPDYFYLSCLMVFLGHVFSIWLKFKGGKGVATYLGVLFAFDFILPAIFIISWFVITLISRYVSLGSIISSLIVLLYNFLVYGFNNSLIFFAYVILLIITHRSNLSKLLTGSENKINL